MLNGFHVFLKNFFNVDYIYKFTDILKIFISPKLFQNLC